MVVIDNPFDPQETKMNGDMIFVIDTLFRISSNVIAVVLGSKLV